jgi:ATP-dependent RNA helicase DDX19/DBP5
VNSFEQLGLSAPLLKGIFEGLKFSKPSRIQETALPMIVSGSNLVAQSQSGTGKTAAFVLGMLSKVDLNLKSPQAICVANSSLLARQTSIVVQQMGQYMNGMEIYLAVAEDKAKMGDRKPNSKTPIRAQIVVGTPGTIINLLKSKRINSNNIKIFVLDEADKLLELHGLADQTIQLREKLGPNIQILFFSATFNDNVLNLAKQLLGGRPHNSIRLKSSELAIKKIKQFYIDCKTEANKIAILADIYSFLQITQSIIFCNRKSTVKDIQIALENLGFSVTIMSGDVDMQSRDRIMDSFYKGETKVLIASDIASRGIDNLQVTLVINFDIPVLPDPIRHSPSLDPDSVTYYHRIGRAGRFGREGVAINLIHDALSKKQMLQCVGEIGASIVEWEKDVEELEPMLRAITFE